MKYALIALILLAASCQPRGRRMAEATASLDTLLHQYWEQRMQLFPFEATANGDNRYNDRLTITIAPSFRDSLKRFYTYYRDALQVVDSSLLQDGDKLSYRLFRYEMDMNLEGLKYPTHLTPINQFWAFTLEFAQLGSGAGNQPFKTQKDYQNWLSRMRQFPAWVDTAIANMRNGMAQGYVLPKVLVEKMLPQVAAIMVAKEDSSVFWGPCRTLEYGDSANRNGDFDPTIATADILNRYRAAIRQDINPAYQRLYDFLKNEYLPAARSTSGVSALSDGQEYTGIVPATGPPPA